MLLQRLFGFDPTQHKVKTEVLAGVTTFLTMAYILAVNPAMFNDIAGQGMDANAAFTATALASIVGTLIMAIYAKMPFALAPGMGLNAFFVYTVCLGMGYSWQFALTAILIEGLLFVLLTVTNIRAWIVDSIPASLKSAIGGGIGLFIAFIGLKNAGIIVSDQSTYVGIGDLTQGNALLGVIGIIITGLLVIKKVPGNLLLGILITTVIGIPMGLAHFSGVISTPPSIEPIFCQFQWHDILCKDMFIVVFTFLFFDMFDTVGTLVGVCTKAKMVNKDGKIPGLTKAFMSDALATVAGACFGTNTTTTYVESASGIAQGGRTGLTAFTTAICFVIALFFAPLFLAMPAAATAPVLVIVGLFMVTPILTIDFEDYSEAIPAFLTILIMPLAGSISDGIMCGMIAYTVLNVLSGKYKKVNVMMWVLTIIFIARYIFIDQ